MQLGISYYLSFQMLAFSLVLLTLSAQAIRQNIRIGFILFFLMMLPNVYFISREQFFHYVLVSVRSFLCLYIMLTLFDMARMKHFNMSRKPLKIAVSLLIIFLFLSVALQSILLKQGVLLTAPPEYVIANADTLPGEFELEHGGRIRPSSTFGEPSYLGFISLSLFVITLLLFEKLRLKSILLLLLFTTLIMAQTLSGLLSLVLILAIHGAKFVSKKKIWKNIGVLSVVALGTFVLGYLGYFSILERLFDIFDPELEYSGYIRLAAPLTVAIRVFENFFIFGVPLEELSHVMKGMYLLAVMIPGSTVTDNGFVNLFMNYGVTAVLIIWVIWKKIASPLLLAYVFLSSIFNGAFLSFDKTIVFALVFLLTNVVSSSFMNQKTRVSI